MKNLIILCSLMVAFPSLAWSSGYGVFTQGASGLVQANAVIAHPTGPSSLYFNPALMNDVPGRQVEVGTTAVYAERSVDYNAGGSDDAESNWNFPSTFYYTHEINPQVTAGLGVFFPFGLSTEWDDDYAGRYIGTEAEMFTTNINPAFSFRVNDQLSLAAGLDVVYLDATLEKMLNQTAAGFLVNPPFGLGPLPDVKQKFTGDGWGVGYNLGALYKVNDMVSIGATYRSHIDVDVDGDAKFYGVDANLAPLIRNTGGETDIRLPQQVTAGVAVKPNEKWVVEAGVRWEDWESFDELKIDLDQPVLGESAEITPRDWNATWTYNLGGQYRLNEMVAINAGYLYGKDCVPDSTFEPLIPDTDAHLFTLGTDLFFGAWTVSAAFGWEHHEDRDKDNAIGDPAGSKVASAIANAPVAVGTANGTYENDIYLIGLSVGYKF